MDILIIANPASGRYNKAKLGRVAEILMPKCNSLNIALTEYRGHATKIAAAATEDIIIAAGGDGLINEVTAGLIDKDKYFSALPFGTSNVFCIEHDIPLNPIKAANAMQFKTVENLPIGYIDNHHFVSMIGFGFDAKTVELVVNSKKKHRFKALMHVLSGIKVILNYKFKPMTLHIQGKNIEVYHTIISLGKYYGGIYPLGDTTRGKLNIFTIDKNNRFILSKTILSMSLFLGMGKNAFLTDYIKVSGVTDCEVDGEYLALCNDSVLIRIKRQGIKLIL